MESKCIPIEEIRSILDRLRQEPGTFSVVARVN